MANNLTNAEELNILNLITGRTGYTTPTNLYAALLTAITDQEAGTVTEVTGGSYARVQTVGKWAAAASGSISTNADLVFPTATADWGTIVGIGLYDAATVGTARWIGGLTANKVVNNGDIFKILSGSLTLSLD